MPLQHLKTEILQIFFFPQKGNVNKCLADLCIAAEAFSDMLHEMLPTWQTEPEMNRPPGIWITTDMLDWGSIFNPKYFILQLKYVSLKCWQNGRTPIALPGVFLQSLHCPRRIALPLFPVGVSQNWASSPQFRVRDLYRQNCPWTVLSL